MEKYSKNKKLKFKDYYFPIAASHRRIRRWAPEIEPQEVLLDSLAKKKEEEIGLSEKKFEVPLSRRILQGLLTTSLILILILFGKTFQFQVVEYQNFSALANENKFIIYQIQAERGVIYDKDLKQLVFNKPSFDLICIKSDLPKTEDQRMKVLKEISRIIDEVPDNLKKKIEEAETPQVLISESLDHQTLILLETKIRELPGFQIQKNMVRYYQAGPIFSHLIGFTGKIRTDELKAEKEFYSIFDYVGRDGLERAYEEILRKNPGKILAERDALGNLISQEIISLPESGKSLVLWLDSELQKKIKEELEKRLQILGAKNAVAVALDPQTGGVLSLVSLPSFENNLFQKGADQEALKELLEDPLELKPLFNRVVSGRYLTGSTIKPLIASAVLQEKIINPEKKINCTGKITIPNPWNPTASSTKEDWTVHGWTNLKKAIAESCNVYFYTVGGGYGDQKGLGPTKIKEYLELFGWNRKTGIDLPGEAEGFIPDKEWKKTYFERKEDQIWYDGDTYNLSIGQGYLLITPLEVAASFVPIANGGKLLKPQVVQKIIDEEKNLVEEIQPKIIRQDFIDPKNLQIVREGMREAVTYGSSFILNDLPVKVASKTGTAQTSRKEYFHNWVTVFAPYDNPQIVLTIIIENVKGVQAAALPVAKEVLNWYFTQ